MKQRVKFLLILSIIVNLSLKAQLTYYDANSFPLLGKISENTETRYERLPQNLKSESRPAVWNLGKNTAGLAIRFSTDATSIGAKWKVKTGFRMGHMTDIGIKGLDLYSLEDGQWVFVNSARPRSDSLTTQVTIISNMQPKQREFMLYLPLYDGITDLQIGIDQQATITQPQIALPSTDKPIVAYGTSILQGGCASRPGMAHTNILSRWLNKEIINLGFSGNAQLDYEIAELMGTCEASLYILDFMPNVKADQVNAKLEKFYSILRAKAPHTPIIFIENPIFPPTAYDKDMETQIEAKNAALNTIFNQLKEKDSNITLISSKGMIGLDGEATVDGAHFTDLGFMRYANFLLPVLQKYLKK